MEPQRTTTTTGVRRHWLLGALVSSAVACGLVVWSAAASATSLGAPAEWAWILTGLQVFALWSAGRDHHWAWLLGTAVQPVWITYAMLTGQAGFVLGCLVSAAVQLHNYLVIGEGSGPAPAGHGHFTPCRNAAQLHSPRDASPDRASLASGHRAEGTGGIRKLKECTG